MLSPTMSMLSERSPARMHGKTKRMSEHSNYQCRSRYSADLKRTKIETGNLLHTGVKLSGNSKVDSNVVVQAATLRASELNDSKTEHRMPPMPPGKANDLQQQLTKKNVKVVGDEAKSTKMTSGDAFLASAKSKTPSHLMPHARSHSMSKNSKGVSVSREFPQGLERLDLPPAKSEVLTNRVSQLASSLDGALKISDKQDFSPSGRRLGKNDSPGVAAWDQSKLKQVCRDETCKVAQRKLISEEEVCFSSPKGQNDHGAENFSEKMSRSERPSCSFKSKIEAHAEAKHQGQSVPEPTEAQQRIKKSASITESAGSGVPKLNVALDVAFSPQFTNFSTIRSYEFQQVDSRDKVCKALKQFKELFSQLLEERESELTGEWKGSCRTDLKAAHILKKKGKWINCHPYIGNVPGVEIGDRFQYRVELAITGLHHEYMCGIHCEQIDGKAYATSIVDSGRYYHNETISADEFIYMGEGGNPEVSSGLKDQTLDRGNLALKNSMDSKIPVRVIRGCQTLRASNTMGINKRSGFAFVYDGLYQVTECNYCHDPKSGKHVFKFRMKRMTDDPNPTQPTSSVPGKSTVQRNQGVIDDIGCQKEKMLSAAVKNFKTSKFTYSCKPNGCGSARRYSSGLWNKDESFDYEAVAPMAKPVISNRRPYANCAKTKFKLS